MCAAVPRASVPSRPPSREQDRPPPRRNRCSHRSHASDRFGGHVVMSFGSLIGALGLFLIVHAASQPAYLAVWCVLGVAMAANLYDAAFGSLGRIFGAAARRPITALTLAGGFASTA